MSPTRAHRSAAYSGGPRTKRDCRARAPQFSSMRQLGYAFFCNYILVKQIITKLITFTLVAFAPSTPTSPTHSASQHHPQSTALDGDGALPCTYTMYTSEALSATILFTLPRVFAFISFTLLSPVFAPIPCLLSLLLPASSISSVSIKIMKFLVFYVLSTVIYCASLLSSLCCFSCGLVVFSLE